MHLVQCVLERMNKPSFGRSSNRVFPCHLIRNINTLFCVIESFDTFWCLFGIISYGDVLVEGAENSHIFLVLPSLTVVVTSPDLHSVVE